MLAKDMFSGSIARWTSQTPSLLRTPESSIRDAQDARIETLETLVSEQRQRMDDLYLQCVGHEAVHANLRYVQEQLCECILAKSTTVVAQLRAQLARQRASASLMKTLQQPELALVIGQAAGLAAAHSLSALSRVHGEGSRKVFSDLISHCSPLLCRLGGFEGAFPSAAGTAECLDPVASKWHVLPAMITGRIACGAASVMDKLYVFGGCSAGLEDLASAEVFDPCVGAWQALPRMPAARRLCTAAALAGKIYIFGRGPNTVSEPIGLCFDPKMNSWEILPRMPFGSLPCVAVAVKRKLYLFSCADESMQHAPTAERYDPAKNMWEVLPNIPTPRRSFAAACVAGKIYVCGGMSLGPEAKPLATVERLDPDHCGAYWESLPSMRTARGACAAAASRGKVYLFGGSTDDVTPLATTEYFDPKTSSWEVLPGMCRGALLCAVAPVDVNSGYKRPVKNSKRVLREVQV